MNDCDCEVIAVGDAGLKLCALDPDIHSKPKCERCNDDGKLHVVLQPEVTGFSAPFDTGPHPKRPCPDCSYDGHEKEENEDRFYGKGLQVLDRTKEGDQHVTACAYRSSVPPLVELLNELDRKANK